MRPRSQPFDQLEKEMLNGQKLQGEPGQDVWSAFCKVMLTARCTPFLRWSPAGVETAKELHIFLKARGKVEEYPLFTFVVRPRPANLPIELLCTS